MAQEKTHIERERTKIFIFRERLRRELMKTKPGGTICLNYEQTQLLTKWLKELEERTVANGIKKH